MDKNAEILAKVKGLAHSAKTWADLSNSIYDPFEGVLVKTLQTREERTKFRKTKEYKEIKKILGQKIDDTGLIKGATPVKSGKFVVRLPKSLHAALDIEAEKEGTSLNQLVLTKLAVQLDTLAGGKLASIIQAFGEIREGYSVDRVIADPKLDRKLLRRCRELSVAGTDYEINWTLMNERKKGGLSHLPRTKRYTVKEIDEFEYASELVVRFLQERYGASLDRIICDPEMTEEFDKWAAKLAPGFTPLQYRWAAFGLRKAGRLGKNVSGIEKSPELECLGNVESLRSGKIPKVEGLYLFSSKKDRVFLSQTDNLRHRIERHLEVSKSHGLPDWLWDSRKNPLKISIGALPGMARSKRQRIEVALVKKWEPLLNLHRVA